MRGLQTAPVRHSQLQEDKQGRVSLRNLTVDPALVRAEQAEPERQICSAMRQRETQLIIDSARLCMSADKDATGLRRKRSRRPSRTRCASGAHLRQRLGAAIRAGSRPGTPSCRKPPGSAAAPRAPKGCSPPPDLRLDQAAVLGEGTVGDAGFLNRGEHKSAPEHTTLQGAVKVRILQQALQVSCFTRQQGWVCLTNPSAATQVQ